MATSSRRCAVAFALSFMDLKAFEWLVLELETQGYCFVLVTFPFLCRASD